MVDRLKNTLERAWIGPVLKAGIKGLVFIAAIALSLIIANLVGLAFVVIPALAAYLLGGWVDPDQVKAWSLGMEMVVAVGIWVTLSIKKRHRRTGAHRKPLDQPSAREAQHEGR